MQLDYPFVLRRSLQAILGITVAAILAALAIILAPPPVAAMVWVADREAGWLLNEQSTDRQFLIGQWFNKGLSRTWAERVVDPSLHDAERIGRALVALKPFLVSQPEIPHGPAFAPPGVAGLGWCNHVNAFAGEVLATSFSRVELIAVTDLENRSSHSYGRAWSPELKDWLYFDAWPDEIVVFQATPSGPRYLFKFAPMTTGSFTPKIVDATHQAYDLAGSSFTLYQLHSSLGRYLADRIANRISHGSVRAARADEAMAREAELIGKTVHRPGPRMRLEASREYLLARIAHSGGQKHEAVRHYLAAAKLDADGPYRRAAVVFADRLDN